MIFVIGGLVGALSQRRSGLDLAVVGVDRRAIEQDAHAQLARSSRGHVDV